MKFFENLRRFLDRPPPAPEPAPSPEGPPRPEPVRSSEPVRAPAAPAAPAVDHMSEVRAAFEALAEAPVAPLGTAAEPELESATTAPAPDSEATLTPVAPEILEEDSADVPDAASVVVGDALILTRATPAATFTIAKSATLGRGEENTIRLDDVSVSRRHARIAYRQGGYWLSDLGSMGGTWVEGTRLTAPRRIAAGEVIDIGLYRLTASFTVGAAKAPSRRRR